MREKERSKDTIPFREMTTAQKFSYLWDYWKIPALVVVVAVVCVSVFVYNIVTATDPELSLAVVDAGDLADFSSYVTGYAEQSGLDPELISVADLSVGTTENGGGPMSQTGMAFFVQMQSGSMDVIIMPEASFLEFAEKGYFLDLTDTVPAEWQEKLLVVEQSYDDYEDEQPEPMACALHLRDLPNMPSGIYYDDAVIAISYYPAHYERAADFLSYLMGE